MFNPIAPLNFNAGPNGINNVLRDMNCRLNPGLMAARDMGLQTTHYGWDPPVKYGRTQDTFGTIPGSAKYPYPKPPEPIGLMIKEEKHDYLFPKHEPIKLRTHDDFILPVEPLPLHILWEEKKRNDDFKVILPEDKPFNFFKFPKVGSVDGYWSNGVWYPY